MELTILGSGGCMVIPKPMCRCMICEEARLKGPPYERSGPSAFFHGVNLLIDTPAEIGQQLNRAGIEHIDYLMFSHLDPDHVEGFRVVEQITLDFRSWHSYPDKQICLILPEPLNNHVRKVQSIYGPLIDFYVNSGFLRLVSFQEKIKIGRVEITAIPVGRDGHVSFVYVFQKGKMRLVYAPCDIKPFPEERQEVEGADLLVIQPGLFETGLKHGFRYPADHISRKTLYTFEETLSLAERINAAEVLFVHLEEYWNRSYDDYLNIEKGLKDVRFAFDGMRIKI